MIALRYMFYSCWNSIERHFPTIPNTQKLHLKKQLLAMLMKQTYSFVQQNLPNTDADQFKIQIEIALQKKDRTQYEKTLADYLNKIPENELHLEGWLQRYKAQLIYKLSRKSP